MTPVRSILLVESDAECGRALARLLRRRGHHVRLVRTARAAGAAAMREPFDLAVVDILVRGGGVELARQLSRRVSRLYLSVGARLLPSEIVELALGFPVLRKTAVPAVLGGAGVARSRESADHRNGAQRAAPVSAPRGERGGRGPRG